MSRLRDRAQAVFLIALLFTASHSMAASVHGEPSFVPGRGLVGFRPGVPETRARGLMGTLRARRVREIPRIGVNVVELPAGVSEEATARALAQHSEVAFAELDYIRHP